MVQITWQLLKEQTTTDDTMQLLLQTIEEGFPEKQADTPKEIREYHIHRSHLYSTDGVAVYKDRVIIPVTLREDCGSSRCHNDAIQGRSIHILARHRSRHFTPQVNLQQDVAITIITAPVPEHLCRPHLRGHRAHCRTLVQRPCRELAIHIRNLRHSRRYHNRRGFVYVSNYCPCVSRFQLGIVT